MNDTTQAFRAIVRNLRKHFPVEQPVLVVRRRILCEKTDAGLTTFNGRCYRIRVKANQEWQGQADTILHEWAHVCAIEEAYKHKGRWGPIFGEIQEAWTHDFPDPTAEAT